MEYRNSNPLPIEREVKNMAINFEQHPATHSVLRLVLEQAVK